MTQLLEQVRGIIVDLTAANETDVVPEASLIEDLDLDSLDRANLISSMEKSLSTGDNKLKISDEDAQDLDTVQHILNLLESKGL